MKTLKNLSSLLVLGALLIFSSCNDKKQVETEVNSQAPAQTSESASNQGQAYIAGESETPNALRIAINSEDHTTLVAAVEAAGVQNSLVNVAPLTVFAPTNAAFDKLPDGTVEDLVKPENKNTLATILKNHVAPSNYPVDMLEKNIARGRTLYMASGENVEITQQGDDLFVGGAKIIGTVKASNGWVHIVDNVILPKNN